MENNIASQYYEQQQQGRLPLKKRKYRDELLELETANSNTRLPQYNNTVYKLLEIRRIVMVKIIVTPMTTMK